MHVQMGPLVRVRALAVIVASASDLHPSGHEESLDVGAIASLNNGQRSLLGHGKRQESGDTLKLASFLLEPGERAYHCDGDAQ
jgi:hypothetical protein